MPTTLIKILYILLTKKIFANYAHRDWVILKSHIVLVTYERSYAVTRKLSSQLFAMFARVVG